MSSVRAFALQALLCALLLPALCQTAVSDGLPHSTDGLPHSTCETDEVSFTFAGDVVVELVDKAEHQSLVCEVGSTTGWRGEIHLVTSAMRGGDLDPLAERNRLAERVGVQRWSRVGSRLTLERLWAPLDFVRRGRIHPTLYIAEGGQAALIFDSTGRKAVALVVRPDTSISPLELQQLARRVVLSDRSPSLVVRVTYIFLLLFPLLGTLGLLALPKLRRPYLNWSYNLLYWRVGVGPVIVLLALVGFLIPYVTTPTVISLSFSLLALAAISLSLWPALRNLCRKRRLEPLDEPNIERAIFKVDYRYDPVIGDDGEVSGEVRYHKQVWNPFRAHCPSCELAYVVYAPADGEVEVELVGDEPDEDSAVLLAKRVDENQEAPRAHCPRCAEPTEYEGVSQPSNTKKRASVRTAALKTFLIFSGLGVAFVILSAGYMLFEYVKESDQAWTEATLDGLSKMAVWMGALGRGILSDPLYWIAILTFFAVVMWVSIRVEFHVSRRHLHGCVDCGVFFQNERADHREQAETCPICQSRLLRAHDVRFGSKPR